MAQPTLAINSTAREGKDPDVSATISSNTQQIVLEEFPARPSTHNISESISKLPFPTESSDNTSSDTPAEKKTRPDKCTKSLPPALRALFASVTDTLFGYFSKAPPHTIQRLAELILFPHSHYRTLPSYLHALDRVVHVTSPASLFPLPPAVPHPSSFTLLSNGSTIASVDPMSISWSNSVSIVSTTPNVGVDDALGGALLTPISWLRKSGSRSPLESEVMTQRSTEIIEGPNGPGGVETVLVSINGVISSTTMCNSTSEDTSTSSRAQSGVNPDELLSQGQETDVVSALQLHVGEDRSDDEELPQARGPEEIVQEYSESRRDSGGSTQAIDVEEAVGVRFISNTDVDNKEEILDGEPEKNATTNDQSKEEKGPDNQAIPAKREALDPYLEDPKKRSKVETNPSESLTDEEGKTNNG